VPDFRHIRENMQPTASLSVTILSRDATLADAPSITRRTRSGPATTVRRGRRSDGLPPRGHVNVIREDRFKANLLFASDYLKSPAW
jgi:hypothetical protein